MSQAFLQMMLTALSHPPSHPDLSPVLFMEEVSSRLLLFQLGTSYLCHAACTTEVGPEQKQRGFPEQHILVCARYLFHPFC